MTASGLRTFVLIAGALMVGGIAQAQQASRSSSSTVTAPPQAASPAAKSAEGDNKSAAAQPAKTAAVQKSDEDAQLMKDARNAGFKPEKIRGNLMFCRTAVELGSSFPVRTCYNAYQVTQKIQEYQTERTQLQQMHNTGLMTH
ncbi:MAG: hypothetical protein ACRET2_01225 [Steroidobacteraceae bacterium]